MSDERNNKRTEQKTVEMKDGTTAPGAGYGDGADLPEWLGKGLRDLYDDVLNDPVPDDFQKLLDQLDRKTGNT